MRKPSNAFSWQISLLNCTKSLTRFNKMPFGTNFNLFCLERFLFVFDGGRWVSVPFAFPLWSGPIINSVTMLDLNICNIFAIF